MKYQGHSRYSTPTPKRSVHTCWCYQMETFSVSLILCEGNPAVTGGLPSQRSVTRNLDIFLDLRLNKRMSKRSRRRWFETPSRSLCCHLNDHSCFVVCCIEYRSPWWRHEMETFSALLAFCWGFTGHRWISLTKASGAELWCFLWSAPEQRVVQTIETPVIWHAITLIMTSL